MLLCPKACACLKHSNFLKVRVLSPVPYSQAQHRFQQDAKTKLCAHPEGGPVVLDRNPTTSLILRQKNSLKKFLGGSVGMP